MVATNVAPTQTNNHPQEGDGSELTPGEIKRQKRMGACCTPRCHTVTILTARDPLHQGLIVQRSNLRARTEDLQLDAKLGKTQIVSAHAGLSQQAGYYCNICDCTLKDNIGWLTHINGKYHNRALGMNLKTERVTVDEVRVDAIRCCVKRQSHLLVLLQKCHNITTHTLVGCCCESVTASPHTCWVLLPVVTTPPRRCQ